MNEQKEIKLGWQDTEELRDSGRILEAFLILVNWFERNLEFPIYYYYIISKKDESKKKEFLERFESKKGKIEQQELNEILNQEPFQQERAKVWRVITRFWSSNEVWERVKQKDWRFTL